MPSSTLWSRRRAHAPARRFLVVLASMALLLGVPSLMSQASAHDGDASCHGSNGSGSFYMGRFYSQSGWIKLTSDASEVTSIQVTSQRGAGGHKLNLATEWSTSAVFDTITIPAGGGTFPIEPGSGKLIGFFTPPDGIVGSPTGLTASALLCSGGHDHPEDPIDEPIDEPMDDPADEPTDEPIDDPADEPIDDPAEEPVDDPSEDPVDEPTDEPMDDPVEDPADEPVNHPVDGETTTTSDNMNQPQSAPPAASIRSSSFGHWVNKLDAEAQTRIGADCIRTHDQFWVTADDGKAYHSWHPASYQGCNFGHEHGDDSKTSDTFAYSGGYQPFGFVMSQQEMRHEDHFGHKVTVANDITLAIGLSSGEEGYPNIYDSGITCDWMSKLHMGSYSADALTNHLHEYFLTVQCDDDDQAANTEFSVKLLAPFGNPNEFDYAGLPDITNSMGSVSSKLTMTKSDEPDPLVAPHISDYTGAGGGRGVSGFPALQWHSMYDLREPELWAMHSGKAHVQTPGGGGVKFAPYYIVKNMVRTLDPQPGNRFDVVRTTELCYEGGNRVPGPYCADMPATEPGPNFWKQPESPFNGSLRAVQFKGFGLTNDGGPAEFCTDPFGRSPSAAPCGANEVPQKASQIRNWWQEQSGGVVSKPGWTCITDVDGTCHNRATGGSVNKAQYSQVNGQTVVTNGGPADPYFDASGNRDGYTPAGIGQEWVVDYSSAPGIHAPN